MLFLLPGLAFEVRGQVQMPNYKYIFDGTTYQLNENGVSHLYWPFGEESEYVTADGDPVRATRDHYGTNNWHAVFGSDAHVNGDIHSHDWNGGGCNNSSPYVYAPGPGEVVFARDITSNCYRHTIIIRLYTPGTTTLSNWYIRLSHLSPGSFEVQETNVVFPGMRLARYAANIPTDPPRCKKGWDCSASHVHITLYKNVPEGFNNWGWWPGGNTTNNAAEFDFQAIYSIRYNIEPAIRSSIYVHSVAGPNRHQYFDNSFIKGQAVSYPSDPLGIEEYAYLKNWHRLKDRDGEYYYSDKGGGKQAGLWVLSPNNVDGLFDLDVYIPNVNETLIANVNYYIRGSGGAAPKMVPVNQQANKGKWVSLGQYYLRTMDAGQLVLSADPIYNSNARGIVVWGKVRYRLAGETVPGDMLIVNQNISANSSPYSTASAGNITINNSSLSGTNTISYTSGGQILAGSGTLIIPSINGTTSLLPVGPIVLIIPRAGQSPPAEIAEVKTPGLRCYPNPASTVVNLEWQPCDKGRADLVIYNSEGKVMKRMENQLVSSAEKQFYQVQVSQWPAGNYLLTLSVNGKPCERLKWIKQ